MCVYLCTWLLQRQHKACFPSAYPAVLSAPPANHLSYQLFPDCVQQSYQHHLHTFILSAVSWLCSAISSAPPAYIYLIRYFLTVFNNLISTTCIHLSYQLFPDCIQQSYQHHLHTFILSAVSWLCSAILSAPPAYIYLISYFLTVFSNLISTTCIHLSYQLFSDCVQQSYQHHLHTFILSAVSWLCSAILSAPPAYIYLISCFLTVFSNLISTTCKPFILSAVSWLCSAVSSASPAYIYHISCFLTVFSNLINTTCIHLSYQLFPDCVQQSHPNHLHTFIISSVFWLCSAISSAPPANHLSYQLFPDCVQHLISTTCTPVILSAVSWLCSAILSAPPAHIYPIRYFLEQWACPPILSAQTAHVWNCCS